MCFFRPPLDSYCTFAIRWNVSVGNKLGPPAHPAFPGRLRGERRRPGFYDFLGGLDFGLPFDRVSVFRQRRLDGSNDAFVNAGVAFELQLGDHRVDLQRRGDRLLPCR